MRAYRGEAGEAAGRAAGAARYASGTGPGRSAGVSRTAMETRKGLFSSAAVVIADGCDSVMLLLEVVVVVLIAVKIPKRNSA